MRNKKHAAAVQQWRRESDGVIVTGEWIRICLKIEAPETLKIGEIVKTKSGTTYQRIA